MVHCVVSLGVFVPFEQWEINNPQGLEVERISEAEFGAHVQTEFGELFACGVEISTKDQHQIARLCAGVFSPFRQSALVVELVDAGLEAAICVALAVHETTSANLWALDPIGQSVELFACVFGCARDHNAEDGFCTVEDIEPDSLSDGSHVLELHAKAEVRLVDSVLLHGLVKGHARKVSDFSVEDGFEKMADQPLEGVEDVFLFDEAHFAVHLGELRLAVGAQVFISEALDDLIVLVKTTDHQELLEGLGALGKGVELSGVHPTWYDKVTCALWRRFNENRRFYVDEVDAVEVFPGLYVDSMAEEQVPLDRASAQIQIAVLHAQVIPSIGVVFDGEGRGVGCIENGQVLNLNLDLTGRDLHVLGLALAYQAGGLDYEFTAEFSRFAAEVCVGVHVERELCDAVAVAEVDECEAAEVAGPLDPSAQDDGLSDVVGAEFAAGVGTVHLLGCDRRCRLCFAKVHRDRTGRLPSARCSSHLVLPSSAVVSGHGRRTAKSA